MVNLPSEQQIFVAAGVVRWVLGEEYGVESLVVDHDSQEEVAHYIREQV